MTTPAPAREPLTAAQWRYDNRAELSDRSPFGFWEDGRVEAYAAYVTAALRAERDQLQQRAERAEQELTCLRDRLL